MSRGVRVQMKLEGSAELMTRLKAIGARASQAVMDAAVAGATPILFDANLRAHSPHVIAEAQQKEGANKATVRIGPDKAHWYYRFFEFGATVHEIKAKKALALLFPGQNGDVFAKKVEHTGMAARPFLRPAMDTRKDDATRAAGETFRQVIESYTK